jgi:Arc/MetJ-type ribon-helix-helix transcriptional regulator
MARAGNTARTLSVRLPTQLAEDLERLARYSYGSVAHEVREAVKEHLAARLSDDKFVQRVQARIQAEVDDWTQLRQRHGRQPR